jgi:hypothetical protein
VEECDVSDLKDYEQRCYVQSRYRGEFYGSEIERSTVEPEQYESAQEEADPHWQARMMQRDAHHGIARRFENRCQKHEEEGFHTASSQAPDCGASTSYVPKDESLEGMRSGFGTTLRSESACPTEKLLQQLVGRRKQVLKRWHLRGCDHRAMSSELQDRIACGFEQLDGLAKVGSLQIFKHYYPWPILAQAFDHPVQHAVLVTFDIDFYGADRRR